MKLLLPALLGVGLAAAQQEPNIVFIITDDQDLHLGSLETMEVVQRGIVSKGASFSNHWATTAQCCPSRTSIVRGQQAHNTIITNIKAPRGNHDNDFLCGVPHRILYRKTRVSVSDRTRHPKPRANQFDRGSRPS